MLTTGMWSDSHHYLRGVTYRVTRGKNSLMLFSFEKIPPHEHQLQAGRSSSIREYETRLISPYLKDYGQH